jgi:hypothetical protein
MKTISAEQSVAMIPGGASLMIDGFMAVGAPARTTDGVVAATGAKWSTPGKVAEMQP